MAYTSFSREDLIYHAIGDRTRRAIIKRLASRRLPAGEVAERFSISRPAVSKHLRVLVHAGLVREQREGRLRYYKLTPGPLRVIDRWLEDYRGFWKQNLRNLKTFVESSAARG